MLLPNLIPPIDVTFSTPTLIENCPTRSMSAIGIFCQQPFQDAANSRAFIDLPQHSVYDCHYLQLDTATTIEHTAAQVLGTSGLLLPGTSFPSRLFR